jgi:RNA polymerase sigma factor (sigma-70 family)
VDPGDPSDSDLITASLDQPDLFATVFERHYEAVFGFAGAAVGVDQAADIASEAFLRAFQLRHRYDARYRSARPWLFGITANLIADHYRRLARQHRAYRRLAGQIELLDQFEEQADSRSDAVVLAPMIEEALRSLRPEELSVVCLFVFEDFSYVEIAQALAIPEGTVRSRLSRARARLRNQLGTFGEVELGDSDE